MTETIQQLLDTFELLPETEKQEFAFEILKRTIDRDIQDLSDEALILNAEEMFLALDRQEKKHD